MKVSRILILSVMLCFIRLVQNDEAQPAHREQEARGQTFHNILAIYSIWHECHLQESGIQLLDI